MMIQGKRQVRGRVIPIGSRRPDYSQASLFDNSILHADKYLPSSRKLLSNDKARREVTGSVYPIILRILSVAILTIKGLSTISELHHVRQLTKKDLPISALLLEGCVYILLIGCRAAVVPSRQLNLA